MSPSNRLIIILNGVSRKKEKFYSTILPALKLEYQVDVWETESRDHAIALGSQAVQAKPFGILAAGGDGTLNQVLNGMLQSKVEVLPTLGIIPLGTGNDFARMIQAKPTAQSLLSKLKSTPQLVDIGQVISQAENGSPTTRYFLNAASLGMGPAVVLELFNSSRAWGASLTYLRAILKVFFTHKGNSIVIKSETWQWQGTARVFAVANGQSFGGGIFIAPKAQINDGQLNTFLASDLPLLKFLWVLQRIKAKQLVENARIQYNTTQSINISSSEPCFLETEGELAGMLPAKISVIPSAFPFFL